MTPEKLTKIGALPEGGYLNERGNQVNRGHWHGDRYAFDFDKDFNGWRQFDTDQDAWYYGVWTRASTLETFSYCEGDIILVKCPDIEHYNAEIRDLMEFHAPAKWGAAIDTKTGQVTEFFEDRSKHLCPA